MVGLARSVLLELFRQVLHLFFREIEVVGAPARATGRRLFAANHVNGLVDPLLVMAATRCSIAPVAKATLWGVPGLSLLLRVAEAVPVVRRRDDPNKSAASNDEVFERVAAHLRGGKNILIFPEGISHSEPQVQPLRSGAGRMLAEAHRLGARGLTFQAVGLEFEARGTFRSRALVVFGPVRSVDELGEALRDEAGDEPRDEARVVDELARRITEKLAIDLPELVVEGRSSRDRQLIARVAELIAHDDGDGSLRGWNVVGRQVEAVAKALPSDGQGATEVAQAVARVSESVGRYYAHLAASGAIDRDVVRARSGDDARALRALGLALLAPFALLGAASYVLPYQVPKLAPRLAKGHGDVVSTYKLGLALVVFPLWATLLSGGALLALPWPEGVAGALLAWVSPFAVLPWLDAIDRVQGATVDGNETPGAEGGGGGAVAVAPAGLDELVAMRREAVEAIEAAREAVGRAAA